MKKRFINKFLAFSFKGKLILVFTLVSLIPTVTLILVSNFIISQSINRWESVSTKLRELGALPTSDKALDIASDYSFLWALESNANLSEINLGLPDDYVAMFYDTNGKLLYSSVKSELLGLNLDTLESIGLPSIHGFTPGVPVTSKGIRLKNDDLALSGVMCQAIEDGSALGVVVVGQLIPAAPSGIGSEMAIAILLFSAVLIFLIAIWISSLIAHEITEPIQKLVLGTREVANGNLDYKVNIQTRDEIGLLANSFDQMTTRLRSNAEELKRAEKLAAWREVAQKLAHEIKNPLTPIQLSAERLHRRFHSRPEGYGDILDECIDTIIGEVTRIRGLLDEFSRLAKMPEVKPIPSDINSIVIKSLRLYGEYPDNIKIQTNYAQKLPLAYADPGLMEQAFFNIIKNAVEAMIEGGMLTVTTGISNSTIDNKYLKVEFADTGPGISEDSMKKLFTPHFSTKKGGAGLGLAIVKKIITDHGGDVTVESKEREGTKFTFIIPVAEGEIHEV